MVNTNFITLLIDVSSSSTGHSFGPIHFVNCQSYIVNSRACIQWSILVISDQNMSAFNRSGSVSFWRLALAIVIAYAPPQKSRDRFVPFDDLTSTQHSHSTLTVVKRQRQDTSSCPCVFNIHHVDMNVHVTFAQAMN